MEGRDMKRIWPWLLLLLLLMILCVCTKQESIHVSSDTKTNVTETPIVSDVRYIDYAITQKDNGYVLKGNFTNTQQQTSLTQMFTVASSSLIKKGTSTNVSLVGEEGIALTRKILPSFIENYKNGKITYSNNALKIYGDVSSYDAQHAMQRLLNTSKLVTQDHSSVYVEKPIDFHIKKDLEAVSFSGTFSNESQIEVLRSKLPASTTKHLTQAKNHIDKGSLNVTAGILPHFMQKYTRGSIQYKETVLSVSGTVRSQEDLESMQTLLAQTSIPVKNHTTIDPIALAQAQEAARVAAVALATAQAQESAKLEEARKAKEAMLAKEKALAEAEALKLEQVKQAQSEAERKAQEHAELAADAKAKIGTLLKIENIEFEVAKGSLTPKGASTVSKLANILKGYPDINVEIAGHTDSDGSAQFNAKLSQSRVDMVKSKLVTKGIEAKRLTAKGYGESKPLVPNTSDENKQKNRRVEINIQGE